MEIYKVSETLCKIPLEVNIVETITNHCKNCGLPHYKYLHVYNEKSSNQSVVNSEESASRSFNINHQNKIMMLCYQSLKLNFPFRQSKKM